MSRRLDQLSFYHTNFLSTTDAFALDQRRRPSRSGSGRRCFLLQCNLPVSFDECERYARQLGHPMPDVTLAHKPREPDASSLRGIPPAVCRRPSTVSTRRYLRDQLIAPDKRRCLVPYVAGWRSIDG